MKGIFEPSIISYPAFVQLCLEDDFQEWVEREEIRDPYSDRNSSEEERVVFNLLRQLFMVDKMLAEDDYEVAEERVYFWNEPAIIEYFESKRPCESVDSQCRIWCKGYPNCDFSRK